MAPFGVTAVAALVAVYLSNQGDGIPTTTALGGLACIALALVASAAACVTGKYLQLVATVAALFLATTWLWIDVGDAREPIACKDDPRTACSLGPRSTRGTIGALAPVVGAVVVIAFGSFAPRRRRSGLPN